MNKEKLGSESAFPNVHSEHTGFDNIGNKEYSTFSEGGMSKRLYIATKIAQGIFAGRNPNTKYNDLNADLIVSRSYEIADELLKQENKTEDK